MLFLHPLLQFEMMMNIQFLYPNFLYALAAIAIPIIIHLFNFRRYKTVYFSNVKFLKNVQQQTQSKSQLKHLLVLISRILAIAALVITFAQPYIPVSEQARTHKNQIVSIYIDNSFSMDAESKYGKLIEVAKNKAQSIISSYKSNTKFLLVTNDFEQKHQHLLNKEQFIEHLGNIKASPIARNISEVLSRQVDFLTSADTTQEKSNSIFLLSDFQKSVADFKQINNNENIKVHLLPLSTQPTNNLYIDSCWFETPGRKLNQPEELFVKIVNKSDESYQNIPVKLFINDSLKALGSFNVDENTSEIVTLSYTNTKAGIHNGRIEISDYPITYDNTFFFNYSILENINILAINEKEENKYINTLFGDDEYFKLTNYTSGNINYSDFANHQVIIINELHTLSSGLIQEISNYMNNGGVAVFFPDIKGDIASYNTLFKNLSSNYITAIDTQKTKIATVDQNSVVYKNVFKKIEKNADLPVIFKHMVFSKLSRTKSKTILISLNNHTMLSEVAYGKGKLYMFAASLSEKSSNLAGHPLFVPTLYNMALFSQPYSPIYYTIGKSNTIELSNQKLIGENVFHIINPTQNVDFIPRYKVVNANLKLMMEQNITNAENYLIRNNHPITGIAFNYDRRESDLSYFTHDEIKETTANLGFSNFTLVDATNDLLSQTLKQLSQGIQLWKWFIIAALVFLGIEVVLLRLRR